MPKARPCATSTVRDKQWDWWKSDLLPQLPWPHHWDWWKSDLLPRLRPGAAIVLVITRWHEGDLAGRLLPEADTWVGLWVRSRKYLKAQ